MPKSYGSFVQGGTHPTKIEYEGKKYSMVDMTVRVPEPLTRAIINGVRSGKIDQADTFVIESVRTKLKQKKMDPFSND